MATPMTPFFDIINGDQRGHSLWPIVENACDKCGTEYHVRVSRVAMSTVEHQCSQETAVGRTDAQ